MSFIIIFTNVTIYKAYICSIVMGIYKLNPDLVKNIFVLKNIPILS